jgi:galactokinase
LQASSLRDVWDRGRAELDAVHNPVDARRARHVLTENGRVLDFVATLGDSDFVEAGHILTASHVSMRDDFEITTEHIDLIADTAVRAGALGARMTGGGFGGCVIALVPDSRAEAVADAVRRTVTAAGNPRPIITRTHAAAGAGPGG